MTKTVFLTWSGDESKLIAETLSSILSERFNEKKINFFYSSLAIRNGEIWINEIMKKLADCCFGVVCLSSTNSNSPWLNFETGAIIKGFCDSSKIFVFNSTNINPKNISGPLTMFQINNKSLNEKIEDLYQKINDTLDEYNKYTPEAIKLMAREDTNAYIEHINETTNEEIDLFISFPIKGLSNLEDELSLIEKIVCELENENIKVYCSAINRQKISEKKIGFERIDLINKCKAYVIIHPEKTMSFTLVECGVALALNKPTLIVGKDSNEDFPNVLIKMSNVGASLGRIHTLNSYTNGEDLYEAIHYFVKKHIQ